MQSMNATATRPASSASVRFVRSLFEQRRLTADPQFFDRVNAMDAQEYGEYLESVLIRCEADQQLCSKTIDWAKKLPYLPKPASEAQIAAIRKIAAKKLDEDGIREIEAQIADLTGGREGTASKLMDKLFAMPFRNLPPVNLPQVPAGRYAVENADGVLTFYHVRVKNNGRVQIDVKAGPATHPVPFNAAGYATILQSIIDAGIKDATIRYGHELGCCGVCGRDLTDADSRAAGIGPVCSQRF